MRAILLGFLCSAAFGCPSGRNTVADCVPANDVAAREAFLTLLSDGAFVCRSRNLGRALAPTRASPVFRFLFTPELRGAQSVFGSFHTLELLFLFRTLDRYNYAPNSSELAQRCDARPLGPICVHWRPERRERAEVASAQRPAR